jgi:hypothetical protein
VTDPHASGFKLAFEAGGKRLVDVLDDPDTYALSLGGVTRLGRLIGEAFPTQHNKQ